MVYPIAKLTLAQFILLWIKKINGTNNIPKDGKFIVAPNHASFFDDMIMPSIIAISMDKKLHNYVNSNYFKNYFLRKFLYWSGSIPVDVKKTKNSKKVNTKAFNLALSYLKKKEPVGIFPEGHRSLDGKLQKAKIGVAKLALTAKTPVLPVGIINSYKILSKGNRFPKFRRIVIVNIGKPMCFDKYYGEINKKNLRLVTNIIMKEIARLSNQEYNF